MYEIEFKIKCSNESELVKALQDIIFNIFNFKECIVGEGAEGLGFGKDMSGQYGHSYSVTIPEMNETKIG